MLLRESLSNWHTSLTGYQSWNGDSRENQLLNAWHAPSYTETTSHRLSLGIMRMSVNWDLIDYHTRPSLLLLGSSTRRNQDSLKSEIDRHELLPLLLIKRGFRRPCHSRNEWQNQDCLCPIREAEREGGEGGQSGRGQQEEWQAESLEVSCAAEQPRLRHTSVEPDREGGGWGPPPTLTSGNPASQKGRPGSSMI